MKLYFALGACLLLAAPAFAGQAEQATMTRLAQSSSPTNVKNVLAQQRASYCEQNARNLGLQGDDRTHYVGTCVNRNEAAEHRASLHGRT